MQVAKYDDSSEGWSAVAFNEQVDRDAVETTTKLNALGK
jgi:hypothetical protein